MANPNPNLTNKKHNQRELANMRYAATEYENHEYTVANGQTDNALGDQTGAFETVTTANYISLRTDQTITFAFNATGNDDITVTSTDSPYTCDRVEFTEIYINNSSGSTANIKIFIC